LTHYHSQWILLLIPSSFSDSDETPLCAIREKQLPQMFHTQNIRYAWRSYSFQH